MSTHRSPRRPSTSPNRRAGLRPGPARRSAGLWPLLLALAVLLFAAGYCFGSREPQDSRVGEKISQPSASAQNEARDLDGPQGGAADGDLDTKGEEAYERIVAESESAPAANNALEIDSDSFASNDLAPGGGARVALVIDDLGRSLGEISALRKLGVAITYAVLPFESRTPQVVERLRQSDEEILCHLPMEPRNGANPGPGALRTTMDAAEIRARTRRALEAVAGAVGVNNHMGSSLTADPQLMTAILEEIEDRHLFFLDSRTSSESVGYRLASEMGIASAERQVFLDPDPADEAVRHQFRRLLDLARRRGAAIAIGHPYESTLRVLAEEVPRARAQGYDFVPVSYLLDRTGDLPEP